MRKSSDIRRGQWQYMWGLVRRGGWALAATVGAFAYVAMRGSAINALEFVSCLACVCVGIIAVVRPKSGELSRPEIGADTLAATASRFADALGEPTLIIDARFVVLHADASAQSQFASLSPGKPIEFALRNPDLLAALESVRSSGEATTTEFHLVVPNETWFEVSIVPLSDEDNAGASQLLLMMRNLTEQKRAEAMRVDFVANVSHELRTPLTSLLGFVDTLQGSASEDEEARARFLSIMRSQAGRMANLINDLLSLSRIEMHQHKKPTDRVDLILLLGEVVEGLQTQAAEAGVEIDYDHPADPIEVNGDRDELFQAFENLLDNALKYGADGKRVSLGLEPVTELPGFDYRVTIADWGIGIDSSHVPRLTERFYRVNAAASRKKLGTGLGLAIVKHIFNRHGGQMTIRSELGVGTSVEVLLVK